MWSDKMWYFWPSSENFILFNIHGFFVQNMTARLQLSLVPTNIMCSIMYSCWRRVEVGKGNWFSPISYADEISRRWEHDWSYSCTYLKKFLDNLRLAQKRLVKSRLGGVAWREFTVLEDGVQFFRRQQVNLALYSSLLQRF